MNTIVPSPAKAPSVEPSQSAADSTAAASPNKGFAAAMESASAKPARKNSPPVKSSGDKADGSKLPPAGNAMPPAPQPSPQNASATTAAVSAPTGPASGTAAVSAANSSGGTTVAAAKLAAAASKLADSTQAPGSDTPSAKRGTSSVLTKPGPAVAAEDIDDADDADDTDATYEAAPVSAGGAAAPSATIAADAIGATAIAAGSKAGGSATAATMKPTLAGQPRTSRTSANSLGDTTTFNGGEATEADTTTSATSSAAPSDAAASAADTAVTPDLSAAVVPQNPSSAQPNAAASAPGDSPTAATVLAAAGASASAAVASSAARVITALAVSTAVDEKHVRAGTESTPAGATPALDGGAGAAQAAASGPAIQSADATTATMKVGASVDSSEFSQGVANQISAMVDKNITSAKLQVNPPALGPIEVRIAVQGDHAQVWMVSHSAVTRDALQSSTPTLREMLNGQGFGQVSVDISQRSFQDRTPAAPTYEWNADADRGSKSAAAGPAGATSRVSSGALDAYA